MPERCADVKTMVVDLLKDLPSLITSCEKKISFFKNAVMIDSLYV